MSETTPGTDRVELTDDEIRILGAASDGVSPRKEPGDWRYSFPHDDLLAAIGSIVAARVQALTAERDELSTVQKLMNDEWERITTDRDAARAELAAANARCAELEAEVEGYSYWSMVQKNAALQETLDRVTVDRIAQVLRDHSLIGRKSQANRTVCVCGNVSPTHDEHRIHQAHELRAALTPEGTE